MPDLLPHAFSTWFASRGWSPRAHQLDLLRLTREGRSTLLIAPTGAGKTLAGFLPSLVDLAHEPSFKGLHTLYISPLKALAVDIARNLEAPVHEMDLPIRIETRTGDTSAHKRTRQVHQAPHILLTTPEQLALLLAHPKAEEMFGSLRRVILDELHALAPTKRGDLLALGLARVKRLAPRLTLTGLSATVKDPEALRLFVSGHEAPASLIRVEGGAAPDITLLDSVNRLPLAGHTAAYAMPEVYDAIRYNRMTLVFVNTRMQAEYVFQELWRLNDDNLPIALHHGSLDATQRRKVEAAMGEGRLKAVVCTATLDLGIDWGDVDCVINLGAPKGASRLLQRIGRANHRLDEPSKALLVPSNRFEWLECEAARAAALAGEQDAGTARTGGLDILAQHILGMACAGGFDADTLYEEVRSAAPYADLTRADFDGALTFAATGGYALKVYERFAKIRQGTDGLWRIAHAHAAASYRLNVGAIVSSSHVKVRLAKASRTGQTLPRGGKVLGEVEDGFIATLVPGDTFLFAGEVLRFEGLRDNEALVSKASSTTEPKIPSWAGGKFPLSTHLAARVRTMLSTPEAWGTCPAPVRAWLEAQAQRSSLPGREGLLVETFPRQGRFYLVAYPFEGRLAHNTLAFLLTRRLERLKARPMGFVINDYALSIWALSDLSKLSMDALFAKDMLGDDLEEWLAESSLMKRTFHHCAVIAGLVEQRSVGAASKTGRQMSMSTGLIYDVLRRHEPDHLLLRAARADAAEGLLDVRRLSDLLLRIQGNITHQALSRVSPLGVSVMLEIGREAVYGEASDALLEQAEQMLMKEALP